MRKKFLSILLAISLACSCSGCNSKSSSNNIEVNKKSSSFEDDINLDNIEETDSFLSVKDDLVEEYLEYFNNITYNCYIENYLTDEEIRELIRKADTIKECTHEMVNTDILKVIEQIKDNSSQYVSLHDDVLDPFKMEKSKNEQDVLFQSMFEDVLKLILKELLVESHNDVKEDFCKINDLSICYGNITKILNLEENNDYWVLGYYNPEENTIILDKESITEKYEYLSTYYADMGESISLAFILSKTLTHELNHMRQTACKCKINAGQEYLNLDYCDYSSVLSEASAESDLYNSDKFILYWANECKSSDYSYSEERKKEALILLLGLINNDKDNYYNAVFDSNINDLFTFLGANTLEEKMDFYRILYLIDGSCYRNDLMLKFDKEDYQNYYNPSDVIGREYNYEILNKFTIDLIQYINSHEDFTLLEAMCLFNIAQAVCLEDVAYLIRNDENSEYCYTYDEEVIKKINDTRINFYEFLKNYYDANNEELLKIIRKADRIVFIAEQYIDYPNSDIIDYESYEFFLELTKKFSLLKPIMFVTDADYFTYLRAYSSSNISLTLN